MAFNIRTKTVSQQTDGVYVATYEAFDDEDAAAGTKTFQIQGKTVAEIRTALAAKVTKLKAVYDQQTHLVALSDSIIQELHNGGIL